MNQQISGASLGEVAYMAYYDHSGGRSLVSGQSLPMWVQLSAEIQAAWEASATAVAQVERGAASLAAVVRSYGSIAYMAFYDRCDGRGIITGRPLPMWDQLSTELRAAWEESGIALAQVIQTGDAHAAS